MRSIHFSGLNGLRAICAIAVVISHITLALKEFYVYPYIFGQQANGSPQGIDLAGYGVTIFFVISGFLITYLLQVESQINPINIKKFYLRRILRIWPLYYLYLILSLITIFAFGLIFNLKSTLYYTFYLANIPFILGTTLPFLAHYWSLGVEEQFYLFWPVLMKKIKFNINMIFLLAFSLVFVKVFLHFVHPNSLLETIISVTRFHCMMVGALGAILYKKGNKLLLLIADNKLTQVICWLIILLCALNRFHIASIINNEIISVVALFLIIGQINLKNRVVNLELKWLNFLGKNSYGIYVIHPLIIFICSKFLSSVDIEQPYKYLMIYVVIISITIITASISFKYFEQYFLNLKKRFVVVKSTA